MATSQVRFKRKGNKMAKINAWDAEVDGKSATKTPAKAKVGTKKDAPSKVVAPKAKGKK